MKKLLHLVVIFAVVLGSVGCDSKFFDAFKSKKTTTEEAGEDASATLAEFNKIEEGMSYREVVAIIGVEGELQSRHTIPGEEGVSDPVTTEVYQWSGVGGFGTAAMNVTFKNDAVKSKTQFGLE